MEDQEKIDWLREDVNRRFEDLYRQMEYREREHRQAHDREHAMTEASNQASLDSINERLKNINEFRAQQSDWASSFALRETVDAQFASLRREIAQASNMVSAGRGMALLAVAIIPVVLFIAGYVMYRAA